MPRTDAATQEQLARIQVLTRQAGLGNHSSHGIKTILGKHPAKGLGKSIADEVIQGLNARIARAAGVHSKEKDSEAG